MDLIKCVITDHTGTAEALRNIPKGLGLLDHLRRAIVTAVVHLVIYILTVVPAVFLFCWLVLG